MKADYGDDLILNWSVGIQRIDPDYYKKEMLDKRMRDAAFDQDVIFLWMDHGDGGALRYLSGEVESELNGGASFVDPEVICGMNGSLHLEEISAEVVESILEMRLDTSLHSNYLYKNKKNKNPNFHKTSRPGPP